LRSVWRTMRASVIKLLMPLAFAAILAPTTLIGTS
jgi:hypothetical protein